MNLTAFDIPESRSEIPTWIESVFCGGDLRAVVAQLDAIRLQCESDEQRVASDSSLDEILGDARGAVLSEGLSALPWDAITSLLSVPSRMLDLQELTMVEGGDYWQKRYVDVQSVNSIADLLMSSRKAISSALDDVPEPSASTMVSPEAIETPAPRSLRWLLAIAAALALAIGTWFAIRTASNAMNNIAKTPIEVPGESSEPVEGIGWGWASDGGVPEKLSGSEYLSALAQGAASWGKKRPTDKAGLIKRLSEFRAGCNRLANMEHPSLSQVNRIWLRSSCRGWLTDIDALIESVPRSDFDAVLAEADAVASRMNDELVQRARA